MKLIAIVIDIRSNNLLGFTVHYYENVLNGIGSNSTHIIDLMNTKQLINSMQFRMLSWTFDQFRVNWFEWIKLSMHLVCLSRPFFDILHTISVLLQLKWIGIRCICVAYKMNSSSVADHIWNALHDCIREHNMCVNLFLSWVFWIHIRNSIHSTS